MDRKVDKEILLPAWYQSIKRLSTRHLTKILIDEWLMEDPLAA